MTDQSYTNLAGEAVPGAHDPIHRYKARRSPHSLRPDGRASIGATVRAMISLDLRHRPGSEIEACAEALPREDDVTQAIACFTRWRAWCDRVRLFPIDFEKPLVSESHQFGGTVELIARIQGRDALVGFAPAVTPSSDHMVMLAAHHLLWREHYPDEPVQDCHLVCLPANGAGFNAHPWRVTDLAPFAGLFQNWLEGLRLEQECEMAMRETALVIEEDG